MLCISLILVILIRTVMEENEKQSVIEQQRELINEKNKASVENSPRPTKDEAVSNGDVTGKPEIICEYTTLFKENSDLIGWLKIEDTVIDYPVMQTMGDETYYLYRDFYKKDNKNGCLLMDTDSSVGVGTVKDNYKDGMKPSTNLIIHGHNMRSGQMFGNLKLYKKEDYGRKHNIIYFDSLYEKREYELIAVFYSQVFYKNEDVFKYYKFFQADTKEEFDNWYTNIKEMSLYDTGITAKLGDEFITLSCCSNHVEDGRFVVVGKRIK